MNLARFRILDQLLQIAAQSLETPPGFGSWYTPTTSNLTTADYGSSPSTFVPRLNPRHRDHALVIAMITQPARPNAIHERQTTSPMLVSPYHASQISVAYRNHC